MKNTEYKLISKRALPCPNCQTKATLQLDDWEGEFNIRCWKCGLEGPIEKGREKAVDSWNKEVG